MEKSCFVLRVNSSKRRDCNSMEDQVDCKDYNVGVSINGASLNGWFTMECDHSTWEDLGVPLFQETSMCATHTFHLFHLFDPMCDIRKLHAPALQGAKRWIQRSLTPEDFMMNHDPSEYLSILKPSI